MASVMDNQLHVARETTYGTPVTPTRSYEAMADGHKRNMEYLESEGFQVGMHTNRSDRQRSINMGGEGNIELQFQNKGMGMLLRAAIGTSSIAQVGATIAWLQTHSTSATAPNESLTVQMGRAPTVGASVLPFTYHGGTVTNWELTQSVGEMLKFTMGMDYEDDDTATALAAGAYVTSPTPFAWPDCTVTVAGGALEVTDFRLSGDNALNTDRRFIRSSVLKKQPIRSSVPTYEGELTGEFQDMSAYTRFVNGTPVAVTATWTGATIVGAENYKLAITMPSVQFRGDTPQVSLGELPEQAMPFKVLWNGTDPAVKIEYTSIDTAF